MSIFFLFRLSLAVHLLFRQARVMFVFFFRLLNHILLLSVSFCWTSSVSYCSSSSFWHLLFFFFFVYFLLFIFLSHDVPSSSFTCCLSSSSFCLSCSSSSSLFLGVHLPLCNALMLFIFFLLALVVCLPLPSVSCIRRLPVSLLVFIFLCLMLFIFFLLPSVICCLSSSSFCLLLSLFF